MTVQWSGVDANGNRVFRGFSFPEWAIGLALALAACIAYFPATRLSFILLDDTVYVANNPHIRAGFTASGLRWAFTSFDPDNWFPLTRLSHMLDYALFGLNPAMHHDVNILIHALASVMLYVFLRRATRERWPSAFVAAVFALHPLHVESVAWVSERKDVLCAFFWFSALWAWVRYAERPSKWRYALALLLFAAGLMSKPMIVTFPLLLPILDIWPLRRPFSRRLLAETAPFVALSAVATVLTVLAQRAAGAVNLPDSFPLVTRVENALVTVFIYIGNTFWPAGLSNPYGWRAHESIWLSTLAGLAIAGISALVLMGRRDRPYLAAGWFWFLVTLLPVIGLVQVGPQARADRYMYVPMTGLLIVVAWGTAELLKLLPRARLAVAVAAGAACLILAGLTWTQQQYWQSSQVLFQHALNEDSENFLAWRYLGATLLDEGSRLRDGAMLRAAVECFRTAAQIRPDLPQVHDELGRILLLVGRSADAIPELEAAVRESPGYAAASRDLGYALLKANRVGEAISQYTIAAHDDPGSPAAHNDLGVALSRMPGSSGEARRQLEQAIALRPDYVLAHCNLGLLLLEVPGAVPDAVRHFIQALSMSPKDLAANLGLATGLAQPPFSDPNAAGAHMKIAIQSAPDPERRRQFQELRSDFGSAR